MSGIADEKAFRDAIEALPLPRQRLLGARFARRVLQLLPDPRLEHALRVAEEPDPGAAELADAYAAARSVAVETYTKCGHTVDWAGMAAHYVAGAVAACVIPEARLLPGIDQPALDAAMQARMARNCERVAKDESGDCGALSEQFRMLEAFLAEG